MGRLAPRYEALYAAAADSDLNRVPKGSGATAAVFDGYAEYLRPHLDLEFLALRNGLVDEDARAARRARLHSTSKL